MLRRALFVSLFAVSFGLPTTASASYYATCDLEVSVDKVVAGADDSPGPPGVRVLLRVTKVHGGGGHNSKHCASFPTRKGPFNVLLQGTSESLEKVAKGSVHRIKYRHVNGMTATGVHSSTSWTIPRAPEAPGKAPKPLPPTAFSKNPLTIAAYCAVHPGDPSCGLDRGPVVIGVSADLTELLRWDTMVIGGCGDDTFNEPKGLVSSKAGRPFRSGKRFAISRPDPMEQTPKAQKARSAAWKSIASAAKGFRPLENLVVDWKEKEAGIQSHSPIAMLGGALKGWTIEAVTRGGKVTVTATRGKRKVTLGRVKAPKVTAYDDEGQEKKRKVYAQFPTVEQVSLATSPKQRKLLILLSSHDGGHCSTGTLSHLWVSAPKGM